VEESTQKLYDLSLRFLSFRPRSEYEIRLFLKKHHASEKDKEEIIKKLKEISFINDEAFALWWLEQRQSFNLKGLIIIKQELKYKKISDEIIEKVISKNNTKIDELDLIRIAVKKKFSRYINLPKKELYIKLGRHLQSKGFEWDDIKTVIDEIINKE